MARHTIIFALVLAGLTGTVYCAQAQQNEPRVEAKSGTAQSGSFVLVERRRLDSLEQKIATLRGLSATDILDIKGAVDASKDASSKLTTFGTVLGLLLTVLLFVGGFLLTKVFDAQSELRKTDKEFADRMEKFADRMEKANKEFGERMEQASKALGDRLEQVSKTLAERIEAVNKDLGSKVAEATISLTLLRQETTHAFDTAKRDSTYNFESLSKSLADLKEAMQSQRIQQPPYWDIRGQGAYGNKGFVAKIDDLSIMKDFIKSDISEEDVNKFYKILTLTRSGEIAMKVPPSPNPTQSETKE